MINLVLGITQSQTFTVTLNEKIPCETYCYTPVFKFQNILTGELKYFTTPDLSSWPSRYNIFQVELVPSIDDEDLLDGKIFLKDVGTYFYDVYNQPCTEVGINPDSFINTLEVGYMKLSRINE